MRLAHWFYTVPLRLRSLFRRGQVEQELDEGFQYHLERQIQEYIAKGTTPEEARYAARKAFGGMEQAKEWSRDKGTSGHPTLLPLLQTMRLLYGI